MGTVDMTVPVTARNPDEMTGKYDVILLLTKQLLNKEVWEIAVRCIKECIDVGHHIILYSSKHFQKLY